MSDDPSVDHASPPPDLASVVEGALFAAGGPLTLDQIAGLFGEQERPDREAIRAAVDALAADYAGRAIEVVEVAGGWRIQVRAHVAPWVARLWDEKPVRYSRALLETLALIAYRQPITRGEIEDIRGVAVSTQIVKTLSEREWIRVVGHRDVPGRPALYATTRKFLDYFGLRSLNDLPPLSEIRDPEFFGAELDLDGPLDEESSGGGSGVGPGPILSVTELPGGPPGEPSGDRTGEGPEQDARSG